MNFLIISLVVYGVAATPIGTTNINQKIIRGTDAVPGQFPYQVSIRNESTIHVCAGAIISKNWIVTSCYCAGLLKPDKMQVVVGSIYLNRGTIHDVENSLVHPDCVRSPSLPYLHDVGLIRVKDEIRYDNFTQPIELFSGNAPGAMAVTISGWGTKSIWPISPSKTLQYINVTALPTDECESIYELSDEFMCTYKFLRGLCLYDYGNPVVSDGKLHAVASANRYCINRGPDIHTRISPYRDWIREITDV